MVALVAVDLTAALVGVLGTLVAMAQEAVAAETGPQAQETAVTALPVS